MMMMSIVARVAESLLLEVSIDTVPVTSQCSDTNFMASSESLFKLLSYVSQQQPFAAVLAVAFACLFPALP